MQAAAAGDVVACYCGRSAHVFCMVVRGSESVGWASARMLDGRTDDLFLLDCEGESF